MYSLAVLIIVAQAPAYSFYSRQAHAELHRSTKGVGAAPPDPLRDPYLAVVIYKEKTESG